MNEPTSLILPIKDDARRFCPLDKFTELEFIIIEIFLIILCDLKCILTVLLLDVNIILVA